MNQRQMELQKDLAEVRAQIEDTDQYKNELLNREASLKGIGNNLCNEYTNDVSSKFMVCNNKCFDSKI